MDDFGDLGYDAVRNLCRRLNEEFALLSQGEHLVHEPFMAWEAGAFVTSGVLRDMLTVFEKLRTKELPVTQEDLERRTRGHDYGVVEYRQRVLRRSHDGFTTETVGEKRYPYGNPAHKYVGD